MIKTVKNIYLGGDRYDKAFKPVTYMTDKTISMPPAGNKHLTIGISNIQGDNLQYLGFYVPGVTVVVDDKKDGLYHVTRTGGNSGNASAWINASAMKEIQDISHVVKNGGVNSYPIYLSSLEGAAAC